MAESIEHVWNKKLAREDLYLADSTNFFMRDADAGCGLLVSNVGNTPGEFDEIAGATQHRHAADDYRLALEREGSRHTGGAASLSDHDSNDSYLAGEKEWPDDLNWLTMEIQPTTVSCQVTIGCDGCQSRSTVMLNVIEGVSLKGFGFQCERHGYHRGQPHIEDDRPRIKGKTYRGGLRCRKVTAGKMRNHAMATPPGDRLMDYLNRAAAKQREDMKVKVKV